MAHIVDKALIAKQFESLPQTYKESLAAYGITKLEQLTCSECPHTLACEFAFDAYNTNGDCLAVK